MDFLIGGMLISSILIFTIAVIFFRRVFIITFEERYRFTWAFLLIMVGSFVLGYLFFIFAFLSHHEQIEIHLFEALVFFFGSIFVFVSAKLNYEIIKNLDKLAEDGNKELKKQQKKALAKERQIQRLKDRFLFIAAHELRAPVTAIKLGIETIKDDSNLRKKCDPEKIQMLDILDASGQRLLNLVNDLLESSRIESHALKIDKKEVDVKAEIKKVTDLMRLSAKEKQCRIKIQIPKTLKKIKTDPARLREVLTNLVSNAIKYNKDKGLVTITVKPVKKMLQFSVTDEGVGFTKKEAKTLFTKFGRIQNDQTAGISGTGLGLHIAEEIVKKLGGKISASSPGTNLDATFTFTLPYK